jgi:hypothetical protein
MSLALTTTHENCYFQRSIPPSCATAAFAHNPTYSDCIAERQAMRSILPVDRGRKGLSPSPPSEPCRRFSRTRLSSR